MAVEIQKEGNLAIITLNAPRQEMHKWRDGDDNGGLPRRI